MKAIIAFVRKLLGIEKSIQRITKPITKIVDQLDALALEEQDTAKRNLEQAQLLQMDADARRANALAARKFAAGLTGGMPAIDTMKDAA